MTHHDFRRFALSINGAVEGAHMGHPDFRAGVSGKIFASLPKAEGDRGVVMLTPEQQADYVADNPETFQPLKGGWGLKGATEVILPTADEEALLSALQTAWQNKNKTK